MGGRSVRVDTEESTLPPAQRTSTGPETFRSSEALKHLNKRQFYTLLRDGRIALIARGLYRKSDWYGDEDLVEIASASPRATIALRSALARHDLIDDIPSILDIAVPRGAWAPQVRANVRWHRFDPDTFDIARFPTRSAPFNRL